MSHTARVGVFMVVALVILGIFIIKIEEIPIGMRGGRVRVRASFPSVAGLDEKSAVRIAGVRVGIVEKVELAGDHAIAVLALEPDVKLHEGARAEVTSLGMLGDKYVELYPGDLAGPPLEPDTTLPGTSPVGFDQLVRNGNEVIGDIKSVTSSFRKTLGGEAGEKRLDDIIENVRQLTASVRALVEANRTNVDATVANFRSFSDTLKTELPRFADKLVDLADHVDALVAANRNNIDASVANVKDITAELRVSAENINKITTKIASGQGSVGKLINDETTVDNLNNTLKSVESGVASLRNTIGRSERWRLDVNARAEALPGVNDPNNNDSRSAVGFDLHTTDKRFYRIEAVSSPVGRTTTDTQTVTTTYPDGHEDTVTQTIVRNKNIDTFNAQVGYLVGDGFTVRAGLFESTGGFGIDKDLLRHQLRLTFEAYDFSRNIKPPHLRLEGRYYLTHNIFAYTGWDDPVWARRSSVLFGAGITWTDEDLKYLLGTAASFGGH
jgi:phospholipid/cholesterol/gamma-HCH transport system substrate-binding protein